MATIPLDVDPAIFMLLALLIFFVAFIYSNLGLGGGLLYVPILLSLAVTDHVVVVPISLTFAAATGLSAFYNHWRRRLTEVRLGLILMTGTLAGAILGAMFTLSSSKDIFILLFIIIIFIFGSKMLYDWYRHPIAIESDDDSKLTKQRITLCTSGEVGSGFLAGALGIGGGLVNVPILIYGLGRGTRKAIGTSSMIVVPTSFMGFVVYLIARPSIPADFWLIPTLFPLVLAGAFIGSHWGLKRLKTKTISLIFIIAVFVASIKMIWDILPF